MSLNNLFFMHSIKYNLILFFFLFYFISFSLGQSKSIWLSKNINNEDGLSNSAVTRIFMDSKGFVWFGTWDGLNMYNGTDIRVFKPDIFKKGSISNNIIRDILEDNKGNIWILTGEGINRLNSNDMSFRSYFSETKNLPVKELNMKACIGPDSSVFISLYGFGMAYYNNFQEDFIKLKLPSLTDIDEKEIIGLYGNPGKTFYLLTEKGALYAYNIEDEYKNIYNKDLTQYDKLLFEKHWFIEVSNSDYLAVALKNGGIFLYNLATHVHMRLLDGKQQVTITTMNNAIDSTNLWIGTDGGSIYKIDFKNVPLVEKMDSYFPDLLSNQVKIWTIEQTSEDLLWIGTDGSGVFRYITKGKPFYNIKKGDKLSGSISHNIVRSIIKDKAGNLWVGTRGDGLNMIPHKGSVTKYYNVENGLSNNAVIALNIDKQDNIWIGVDDEGIDMLETSSGHIFHFPEDFSNANDISFGLVYSICIDVYGSIWLGTSGFGVVSFDVSKNRNGKYAINNYNQLRSKSGEDGLRSDIVYSIVEERPNVLWIGTRGGGLHRLNTLNYSVDVYGEAGNDINGLNNDDILSLCMGRNAQLWIGTSGGLNKLNLAYKPFRFQNFTEYNGLPNNTIHGILEDNEGNIWLSSNKGLSKFLVSEGSFINFNKTDGLQSDEYTDGAVYNDTVNNLLYFGGVEGLDWFNPQQIKPSDQFPPIVFNEFRLYNNPVFPGDSTLILSNSLDETDKIELKYNQNFFSLSFTTLNYFNSQKCEFAHYLEGFDHDWNYIQTERTASFTNVPPGTYTFKVKATNEDGIFGNEIRKISIIIYPPVWNTIYAYFLYTILLALFIIILVRYFKNRARDKRQIEIEKIHRQKENEINQYKLQFFTNIAHEFQTPLTLILAPAVTLMSYIEKDKRLSIYARSIYQNANRLHRLIQELIEFRKVETGNMKLEIRKCELVNYVSELVKAFEHFAKQNEVSLNFICSKPEIESWVDIKKIEKILLNLISNAIKYTPKGGSVEVELELQEKKILFIVRDSGIGIPLDLREKIFDRFFHLTNTLPQYHLAQEGSGVGLSLTKSLIELHKGSVLVENADGGGSVFKVILPSEKEVYEQDIIEDSFVLQTDKITKKVIKEFQIPHDYPLVESVKILKNEKKEYTILIVDDNPQVCNLISSLLVDEYNIYTAHNGNEALAILDVEQIDLVISDVIMPNMDGLELCSAIKSDINTCHIPVILLTTKGELEQRIEGLEAGADSYIPKPFHPKHLKVRIEKLLEAMERFRKSFREYDPQPQSELLQGLSSKDRKLLTSLTDYIEENLEDSSLKAESLSSHQAMSKTQLYRKIKVLTDLTPHGLIKYIRLKKAAFMLQQGNKTVSEVFYETGFNNRTYFYRSFREAYGTTPGEYIKADIRNKMAF
jgi:signal transduction histidine kinase/DNA-binding response OmpR family regulator/ligand-binding sensor domain-containing protein